MSQFAKKSQKSMSGTFDGDWMSKHMDIKKDKYKSDYMKEMIKVNIIQQSQKVLKKKSDPFGGSEYTNEYVQNENL